MDIPSSEHQALEPEACPSGLGSIFPQAPRSDDDVGSSKTTRITNAVRLGAMLAIHDKPPTDSSRMGSLCEDFGVYTCRAVQVTRKRQATAPRI
ncbi:unnamed protein product [Phytophthora lilii]|uniref:Unnamed protein product n=1 Tax=Phytophthora lilii TaxID=2077276 RepID=A0A9W6U7F5_9STRA|nr:unnamed protein product [Phytophthora lilii]